VLERHGLIGCFFAVVSADDVRDSKPSPEPFLAALEAIRSASSERRGGAAASGWTPAQCVAIEDSIHGVRAALAAGMRCVAVAHTYPAAKLTEAHRVVDRIGQLAVGDILGA
jgi:beta-phosphoglucomutase-like phosphatase (HAD superfamily)